MSTSAHKSEDFDNVPFVRMEDVQPSRTYELIPLRRSDEEVLETYVFEYDECVNDNDGSNSGSMVSIKREIIDNDSDAEMIVPEPLDVPVKIIKEEKKPPDSWPKLEILPGGAIKKPENSKEYHDDCPSSFEGDKSVPAEMMYACAKCPQRFRFLLSLVEHVNWHENRDKREIRTYVKSTMERRVARVSEAQWSILVDFLERNPYLARARGYHNNAQKRAESSRLWQEVASLLNAEGSGTAKNAKHWSIYVVNYKCKLKRIVAEINADADATGGGSPRGSSLTTLSDSDKRFLAVMGIGPEFGQTAKDLKAPHTSAVPQTLHASTEDVHNTPDKRRGKGRRRGERGQGGEEEEGGQGPLEGRGRSRRQRRQLRRGGVSSATTTSASGTAEASTQTDRGADAPPRPCPMPLSLEPEPKLREVPPRSCRSRC